MTSRTKTLIGFAVAAVVLGLVPNVVDVLDALHVAGAERISLQLFEG